MGYVKLREGIIMKIAMVEWFKKKNGFLSVAIRSKMGHESDEIPTKKQADSMLHLTSYMLEVEIIG